MAAAAAAAAATGVVDRQRRFDEELARRIGAAHFGHVGAHGRR